MPETVAIIGAGPLGRWLALSAGRAGFHVLLEDVMPANLRHAQEFIREQFGPAEKVLADCGENRDCLQRNQSSCTQEAACQVALSPRKSHLAHPLPGHVHSGLALAQRQEPVDADSGFERARLQPCHKSDKECAAFAPEGGLSEILPVAFVSTIEDAVRSADLAIDCVPDELESKLEILWLLDRMAPPRTVLVTPTTRLSIADLANCTYRPEKCVAIAAEASSLAAGTSSQILLRTTTRTSMETVALLGDFWRRLGFTPVFALDPAEQPAPSP